MFQGEHLCMFLHQICSHALHIKLYNNWSRYDLGGHPKNFDVCCFHAKFDPNALHVKIIIIKKDWSKAVLHIIILNSEFSILFFITFPACFSIPKIFSNLNSNCSNLSLRNLQEQVKKAFCYQKLFWPLTVWKNCSITKTIFSLSRSEQFW